MSITLTDHDAATIRTAAYGAVALIAAADATGKPHKTATQGSLALYSATGPLGHVLAAKSKDIALQGKTVAELADHVLPALTDAMNLLTTQDPTEADNFRSTVLLAIDASRSHRSTPDPVVAAMADKITSALDAA
ncbi:hypothetical protein AB0L57_23955 [Nocardia sp. NPDC052254]|uniref:hypothetical protein n=1 Tax=Nocardia sp. NPDC052254 TaxID=3155681 RepID=UPI003445190A